MSVGLFTIEEKIEAVSKEIEQIRTLARDDPGGPIHMQYEILKAVAADLRARQQLPRNNALGALERDLTAIKRSRTTLGYDMNRIAVLADTVVSKWPIISQALEQFGEVSAE